jgi:hypothetical protein
MAEIRKVVPSAPLSNFSQVGVNSGGMFDLLALAADTALTRLEPAATEEMARRGAEDYTGVAGGGRITGSTMNSPPGPNQGIADDAMAALGKGTFRSALRKSESGGNSTVVNSEGYTGLYQWGPDRLADYNRATGKSVTMAQFRGSASIQEGAQDWHEGDILSQLGGYVGQTVNGQVMDEAALIGMAHLGGVGGARKYVESDGAHNPADSNGTSLSDYARKFGGMAVGGRISVSSQSAPTVLVTDSAGKTAPRLFSKFSGPMLQAYNAAAGATYGAEVMLKGAEDLMGLASSFPLDADGFRQAADGYVKERVAAAPEEFRADIRAELTQAVQRRYLGMVEEKQTNTEQRAANSTTALAEMWAGNYTDALIGGTPEDIAAAEGKLRSLLRTKEALPGSTWTGPQSENYVRDSRRRAEAELRTRQKETVKGYDKSFRTIIAAAEQGLFAADEAMLYDPAAQAANPLLWAEALSQTVFRDQLPGFQSAPKQERDANVAELRDNPIDEAFQADIFKAAEAANKAVDTAFEANSMDAAALYLPDKPPPLPDFTDPGKAVEALQARADFARGLVESGHAPRVDLFTKDEAAAVGLALGKDSPPEVRMAMAGFMAEGFGPDAASAFKAVGADQAVVRYGGPLLAAANDDPRLEAAVGAAFQGQSMIDAGLIQRPDKTTIASVSTSLADAISSSQNSALVEADLMDFVVAGWASEARGIEPNSEASTTLLKKWVNIAAGGSTDARGRATGGIQTIGGYDVLLPIGVRGDALNRALGASVATSEVSFGGLVKDSIISSLPLMGGSRPNEAAAVGIDPAVWTPAGVGASAGSVPMLYGKPMSPSLFRDGEVKLIPVAQNIYRMEILRAGGGVLHPSDGQGMVYMFDIRKIELAAPPEAAPQQRDFLGNPITGRT